MSAFLRPVTFALVASLAGTATSAATPVVPDMVLPRFTEEREAAALCFLRKNASDLLSLVEHLKKDNPTRYQHEIRAVFQVAEMLADLEEDPARHDLELEIWKIESKAHSLAARLPNQLDTERRKSEAELQKMARQLVDLDTRVLVLKAEQAEKELSEIRDELAKARDQGPARAKARYDNLIEQGRKRRKS
jgi:plasmid stabilization system protein ParE